MFLGPSNLPVEMIPVAFPRLLGAQHTFLAWEKVLLTGESADPSVMPFMVPHGHCHPPPQLPLSSTCTELYGWRTRGPVRRMDFALLCDSDWHPENPDNLGHTLTFFDLLPSSRWAESPVWKALSASFFPVLWKTLLCALALGIVSLLP